jgi:membrane-associated phospholipid phosphatase
MKILALIGLLAFKSLYVPLNKRKSKYYWELPIDKKIPLIPLFVLPYLFYFAFTAIAFFTLWNTRYIYPLMIALFLSYAIALPIWYFVPNGVKRPTVHGNSWLHSIVRYVHRYDEDGNGLPSAHVYVALICGHFLILGYPSLWPLSALGAFLISISTLFTKQHYIIDVPGGVAVYILAVALTGFIV